MLRTTTTTTVRPPKLALRLPHSRPAVPQNRLRHTRNYSQPAFEPPTLSSPLQYTVNFAARFLKYSLVGCIVVAGTVVSAFEGTHLWVENVELAKDQDPDAKQWQWDLEAESWSAGDSGGTDPSLDLITQHTIRAAWMAQNWGTGSSVGVVTGSNLGSSAAKIVDPKLEWAQNFLGIAIARTEKSLPEKEGLSATLLELLLRHANVLERINTNDALLESRTRYERAWAILGARGPVAARVAMKLGDLNARLGEPSEALAWWKRALQLAQPSNRPSSQDVITSLPSALPASPYMQRTVVTTLLSISSHYASSANDLKAALRIQQEGLKLIQAQSNSTPKTPAETLHALFISHRSSLLTIQEAEVLFALRNRPKKSIDLLSSAAQASEQIISSLNTPAPATTAALTSTPTSPDTVRTRGRIPLSQQFAQSKTLKKPAESLLRDARRSAADAWNLTGVLSEGADKSRAMECYQRAAEILGVRDSATGAFSGPKDDIPPSEWAAISSNYERMRRTLETKS